MRFQLIEPDLAAERQMAIDVDALDMPPIKAPEDGYLIPKHFIDRLEDLEAMFTEATEEIEWAIEHNDGERRERFRVKRKEASDRLVGCVRAMMPFVKEAQ